MPRLSEETLRSQQEGENYVNTFTTMFSVDELRRIYDEEKQIGYFEVVAEGLQKKKDVREDDFVSVIPRTIEYIKNHIFHGEDGDYYVMSYNDDAGYFPKQLKKELFKDLMLSYFPPLVKKWWGCYARIFHISVDATKGRIYNEGNVHYLNIFNGFPDDHIERNPDVIKKYKNEVNFFWSHIKENLCGNNEQIFQETKNWLCALVGGRRKMRTALYFKGQMGTGRGVLIELITKILGDKNCCRIQHIDQVLGQFNGHLAGKLFVYFDDVKMNYEQFSSLYEALKVPITESKNTYRDLFKTAVLLNNLNSWFLVGNHDLFKLEASAGKCRRVVSCDVSSVMRNSEYYAKLHSLKDNVDFRRAFLWYCQDNYDKNYNEQISIKSLPLTTSSIDAVQHSITPIIEFFKQSMLTECDTSFNEPCLPQKLYTKYCHFYNTSENAYDKKRILKKHFFLAEIKKISFLEVKECRNNGSHKTNWVIFNRKKALTTYITRGYITKDDLVEHNIEDKDLGVTEDDILAEDEARLKALKEEVEALEVSIANRKNKVSAPIIKQNVPIVEPIVAEEVDEDEDEQNEEVFEIDMDDDTEDPREKIVKKLETNETLKAMRNALPERIKGKIKEHRKQQQAITEYIKTQLTEAEIKIYLESEPAHIKKPSTKNTFDALFDVSN